MATGMMVALAACGDDATQPGGEPAAQTFTASVTGGLTRALTGGAHFGRAADGQPGDGFAITLATPDGKVQLFLAQPAGALPAPGTYEIVARHAPDAPDHVTGMLLLPEAVDGWFDVRSGTVRVTRATATEVVGTIELRARGRLTGAADSVDIVFAGAFHAAFGALAPALPVSGPFILQRDAAGNWPVLFDGPIPTGVGNATAHLHVIARDGTLTLGADGRYEQRYTKDRKSVV